jgi:hypothetical protein
VNGAVHLNGNARNGNGIGASGSTIPQKRKLGMSAGGGGGGSKARREEDGRWRDDGRKMGGLDKGGGDEDEIRCRCGSSADDGFSIARDVYGRWCHAACFAISKECAGGVEMLAVCAAESLG